MSITILLPFKVTYKTLDNLRKITRNIKRIISDYKDFCGLRGKQGNSLTGKQVQRQTQIRKTIINYGQTKYIQVLSGTTRTAQTYDYGTIQCTNMTIVDELQKLAVGCYRGLYMHGEYDYARD